VTEVVVTLLSTPQAAPLHPLPERDQVTPKPPGSLLTLVEKPWLWLCCTLAVGGEILFTETAGSTVTLADPERVGSATEVAITVTPELGTEAGAVYSPVLLTVPTAALPPATPFTLHWTPRFCVFCTLAVNCCVRDTFTEAEVGETDTLIGAVMEMAADALLVPSVTDVAVKVTFAGFGSVEGAL
jgi:hypothetical protein